MRQVFRQGRVLTDQGFTQVAVRVQAGLIEALVPEDSADAEWAADEVIDLQGHWLAPGFIDTQVNGGGGVLFNDRPSVEGIAAIGRAHRRQGTTGYLPTLISDDLRVVEQALQAVAEAIAQGVPGVLGLHIEGPFLSEPRRGVHDAAKLRALDAAAVQLLSKKHPGVTLLTLAPEETTPELIRALDAAGVIVSAGHTNASYEELQPALQQGLRGFTHLFNAMSPLTSREPGAVGAALASDAWCGLIVDGHHVHPTTLKIALRARRQDRFMLVTDAMPSVGTELRSFELQGRRMHLVRAGESWKIVDDEGRLAGAHLDMATAVRNAVRMLGLPLEQALRMASRYPAEFLRLPAQGRIAPGQRADLVQLDDRLCVVRTWIAGASD